MPTQSSESQLASIVVEVLPNSKEASSMTTAARATGSAHYREKKMLLKIHGCPPLWILYLQLRTATPSLRAEAAAPMCGAKMAAPNLPSACARLACASTFVSLPQDKEYHKNSKNYNDLLC
jgi:hypothetical protein